MQTIINETKPTIINDHGDDITNHMTKPMKDDGVLSWQIAVILDDIGKLYECIKDSAQALAKNTTTLKQGLTKEFKLAFDNWFNTLSTDELTSIFGPNALINDISAEDDIYKAQITTAKHILSALKPVFVQPASNKTRINQLIDMIRENKNDQESYDFYKPVIIKLLSGLVE